MDYRTIIVHLDASRRCAQRVVVAARLAHEYGAHLIGVYAAAARTLPSSAQAEGAPELTEAWRRLYRERASDSVDRFHEEAARAGLAGAEARVAERDPAGATALNALYADLVVLGQRDPDDDLDGLGLPRDFTEQVLERAGGPVLVVPYAGSYPRVGERILVAWNASRTAARAVRDALPFLRRAARVTVVAVNPESTGDHGEVPGADLALYLARHGVNVEAAASHTHDVDPGSWLISRACDLSIDLLVMGGYGHSRLGEALFGGVTRSILEQMTIPVLLEH